MLPDARVVATITAVTFKELLFESCVTGPPFSGLAGPAGATIKFS
jgi:hypothetical protein